MIKSSNNLASVRNERDPITQLTHLTSGQLLGAGGGGAQVSRNPVVEGRLDARLVTEGCLNVYPQVQSVWLGAFLWQSRARTRKPRLHLAQARWRLFIRLECTATFQTWPRADQNAWTSCTDGPATSLPCFGHAVEGLTLMNAVLTRWRCVENCLP